ncbi:MAG: leucine-rich repeat domain-containing protein [Clostridia bacterium]|nr:leucine-rich repeat domain-containing protein [Clostridia bacterium]MBR2734956.1 leucine-rich repeat domain-containing protein [Clostridia bacterium]
MSKIKTFAKVAVLLCLAAFMSSRHVFAAQKNIFRDLLSPKSAVASQDFQIDDEGALIHYSGSSENVVVPRGVKSVSFGAFMDHSEMKTIKLPEGLSTVDECAFYGCSSLKSIRLPESVTRIERLAFGSCASLERIYIGKNVTDIAELFVCDCPKLSGFEVSDKNKKFQVVDGILYSKDMEDLVLCPQNGPETVNVPDTVVTIKEQSFFECNNLKEVNIGNNVKYIDEAAFYGCKNLKNVNMSNSVKKIRSYAFAECSSIGEFCAGQNMTYIGNGAFYNCSGLDKFTCLSKRVEFGTDIFNAGSPITLRVPDGSDAYRYAVENKMNYETL